MQARKIITSLMLCIAIMLPHYASAGRYCPVTDDGKIRIDQCKYNTNEECKRASKSKRDCIIDLPDPSDKAPYCLIYGWREVCDKYFDEESCRNAAKEYIGQCIPNERYKGAVGEDKSSEESKPATK